MPPLPPMLPLVLVLLFSGSSFEVDVPACCLSPDAVDLGSEDPGEMVEEAFLFGIVWLLKGGITKKREEWIQEDRLIHYLSTLPRNHENSKFDNHIASY